MDDLIREKFNRMEQVLRILNAKDVEMPGKKPMIQKLSGMEIWICPTLKKCEFYFEL
ncbi:hypothetical protein LCGC14_2243990 [marine sediment metagenome]|uniref:Uncharacterized protein n=1 Tax=marine sediment metagenome TaxID=412755 RepID=A0A0F9DS73_9ZZZZ